MARQTTVASVNEAVKRLHLEGLVGENALQAESLYPMALPEELLSRIELGNPNDPILRQFLPSAEELTDAEGFSKNPLAEQYDDGPVLRKYRGRALILTGGKCVANCRFCFRRHYHTAGMVTESLFSESENDQKRLQRLLEPIRKDESIREVILSGSDPLGLTEERLQTLLHYIKTLPLVNRVRIHTRRPILVPKQFDLPFFELWNPNEWKEKKVIFVFHINHPREIAPETEHFLLTLREKRVAMFSQTVLLRGVNDSPEILAQLYEKIFSLGVLPYYLHQLDKVAGASHFEVGIPEGKEIVRRLRGMVCGYLVPHYVREIAGETGKVLL